jgi:hypothetical protein
MTIVTHRKTHPSRLLLSVLAVLGLMLMAPATSIAGPEQLASLQVSPIGTPPGKFDLEALEVKLSNTDAINFVGKIKLKMGIDSLTEAFGEFHNGKSTKSLSELERYFEEFLYRTVGQLQKGDPALARELATSRDAIWSLLTDPQGDWPSPTEP